MKGLLVRVGADQSQGGGSWNAPIDVATGAFAYVAFPESKLVRTGLERPYALVEPILRQLGRALPQHLVGRHMHLDPDFERLSYGDQESRARQILDKTKRGDLLVFYAGLRDIGTSGALVYALIGLLIIDEVLPAVSAATRTPDINAHTRRLLPAGADDIVVVGKASLSGRFHRALPIGEYRDRAYRIRPDILSEWGGVSVRDGYLQRSAQLPELSDADRFLRWLERQSVRLLQVNNVAT